MRCRFTLPLLLLGLFALPVAADPRPDILYTSRREFVRVSPPRPLTLNAHIDKFAYDPLGLEVACAGSDTQEGQTTYFVKTLDIRTGKELHRLAMTVLQYTDAGLDILGWTPSGKYLLLLRRQPRTDEGGEGSITRLERWDLSADPPKVRPVAEDFSVPEGRRIDIIEHYASPHGRRVLLKSFYALGNSLHAIYQVYDAEQNIFQTIALLQGAEAYSTWADDSHLIVRLKDDDKQQQMDVVTGQITPLPTQKTDLPPTSKLFPDLTLTVDRKTQIDSTRSGGFESTLLWVRSAPRQKQLLSVVGAGMVMGKEDTQAVWSPTGKQLAFLNRGELYVTDVALVPTSESLAGEKQALGLPLSCPEEREIATGNMKKIGLGILQYTQDYDEMYPTGDGVDEKLLPYIKSRSVFSVGSVHWAYQAPRDLSLAAMEAPADTVMGTMNLPCGQVVLYADGHVKEMTGKE